MGWLYVPGSAGSNSESSSPCQDSELSVTLSGKHTRRPLPRRGWKRRPWIKRLWGTISRPSTAARGVARWISLLPDSPASHSAEQASDEASGMSGGSGTTSLESLAKYDLATSSWRTCEASLLLLSTTPSQPFSGRWPNSGTLRSGICSARPKSERRTAASDSSCWPTPRASANENRTTKPAPSHGNGHGKVLAGEAAAWATPTSRDWKDGTDPSSRVPTNGLLGRQAPRWATP